MAGRSRFTLTPDSPPQAPRYWPTPLGTAGFSVVIPVEPVVVLPDHGEGLVFAGDVPTSGVVEDIPHRGEIIAEVTCRGGAAQPDQLLLGFEGRPSLQRVGSRGSLPVLKGAQKELAIGRSHTSNETSMSRFQGMAGVGAPVVGSVFIP